MVTGRAGDDVLRGGRGDDTLRGGAGDDLLLGQAGADIYEFGRGDGHDLVNLQDHDSTLELDQVLFLPGISPDDVHARNTDGSGLRLRILGSDDYIDVANYFSSYVQNLIEVRFSDAPSTVWTFTEIDAMRWQATDYDDEIFGRYGDESLFGGAGNDTLWGNDGNDILDGGTDDDLLIGGRGNDRLTGGTGSDVYLYEAGHGNDVIHNLDESALRMDVLRLGATIEAAELRAYRWFDDLLLEHGASMSTISVQDWFLGEAYALDQVEFADGMVWTASVLNGFAATASPYSDHLSGTSADDTLRGLAGDDVLQGAAGNDFLAGDAGADTYFYRAGDGTDVIDNFDGSAAETETVLLGDAIAPEQVNARRSGDDLLLYLSMEGSLRILGHFADAARAITQVQFADGSAWNAEELAARVRIATSGDDELVGDEGYQYLVGGDGNDLLDGRGGNDVLQGDAGNDTYRFGFGYAADQVYNQDKTSGRYDRIEMTAGVQAADVTVQRDADHLYLLLRDTGDSIRVNNHFVAKGKYAGSHIDAVAFADGTQWSRADIASFTELSALGSYVLHGDAQANVLTGFGGDDQLLGHDGDDALHGGAGNDMLRGGLGADWLSGGKGNDVYRFDAGDGADVIENQDLSAGRHDVLEFGAGVTSGQVGVLRLQDDLWLNVGNGDSVLVRNFYQPGGALDSVRFADGSAWSQADLAARATVNVAPDVQGEAYVMQEDGVLTLQVMDLLQNDNDANGDALAVTGVSHALHGDVSYSRDAGTIRFQPDADYFGPAGFRYTVSDGYQSVQGEVSVSVNDVPEPANSTPEAVDDAFALRVGETLVISAATLLANDSDADGDLLELLAVRNALHAGVVFDAQRGEITVVPDEHFVGEASFEYQVSDGASTALGTVRLVVSPESGAQLGTSGDDAMRGGSKADALYGLDGNDVLEGGRGADTLHGGAGNDLLRGGAGDDHYVVKAGEGADVIENAGRKSEYDVLWLTGQTDETRVWLSRSDADLEVTLLGAGGSVTVRDWYADRTGQLHEIHAGGRTLLNDQVESLTEAMSAYVMPTGPDAQIPDALRSTVDAAWQ